jgi:Asp-tRNA(Asn)/Glu-tRNA(Gln) amidotransferase A subunit family amidase
MPFRSATQLAAAIRRKNIGCLELLDLYLARVERYDGRLNAVVVRDFERARAAIDPLEAFAVYTRLLHSATSDRQTDEEFAKNQELRSLAPNDESYFARSTRAAVLSHRDWLAANETRHCMRRAWAEFFTAYDLLLCPVASTAAFKHDHEGTRFTRRLVVKSSISFRIVWRAA